MRVIEDSPGYGAYRRIFIESLGGLWKLQKRYMPGVQNPLVAEDVAQTVVFALNIPHHINLDHVTLRPLAQASQFKVIRSS